MSTRPLRTVPKRRRGEPLPPGANFALEADGLLRQWNGRHYQGGRWNTQWEAAEAAAHARMPVALRVEKRDAAWIVRVQTRTDPKPSEERLGSGAAPPRPDYRVFCYCDQCGHTFTLHELDFQRWTRQGYLLIARSCPHPLLPTDRVVSEHADYRVVRRAPSRPRWDG